MLALPSTLETLVSVRIETVELAKPVFRISVRDAFAATFARPGAVVAYAAPMALVAAIGFAAVVITSSDHMVYAESLPQFVGLPEERAQFLLWALVPLVLAVHVFAASAAALIITSGLLNRRVGVIAAWSRSARLLGRTLPAAIPGVLLIAIAAGAGWVAVHLGAPEWLAVSVLVVFFFVPLPAVFVLSLAVLRPVRARDAWQEVRRVSRAINDGAILVRIPVLLNLAIGIGIGIGLLVLAGVAPSSALNTLLFGTAVVLVAIATMVGAIGVISRLTLEGLSRQSDTQTVELPASAAGSRLAVAGRWLSAAAAVFVPFVLLGGAVSVNPTNITTTSVREIGYADPLLQTMDLGDGVIANLSSSYNSYRLGFCVDQTCRSTEYTEWYGYANVMAERPSGGALAARWILDDESEQLVWTLEVGDVSSSTLLSAWAESPEHFRGRTIRLEPENSRVIDTVSGDISEPFSDYYVEYETDLAVDASGEYPVIASLNPLRSGGRLFTLYRCVDAECSSATKQSTVTYGDSDTQALAPLDIAVAADGTVFASLYGYREGDEEGPDDVGLVVVPPSGDITVTTVVRGALSDGSRVDDWPGSQLVLSSEGMPIVLTREIDSGTFELLICADQLCTESSTQTLPGITTADFRPAITVDSTGRPLIATYSEDGKSVIVLSCTDSVCTSLETRVVARAARIAPPLAISVNHEGLPMVTISNVWVNEIKTFLPEPTRIVLCQQPRCGAK